MPKTRTAPAPSRLVPSHFFEIVIGYDNDTGILDTMAFIFKHVNQANTSDAFYSSCLRSIRQIESMTGMDFFPFLKEATQDEIESDARRRCMRMCSGRRWCGLAARARWGRGATSFGGPRGVKVHVLLAAISHQESTASMSPLQGLTVGDIAGSQSVALGCIMFPFQGIVKPAITRYSCS